MGLLPLILISVGVVGFMLYKNWSQKTQKQTSSTSVNQDSLNNKAMNNANKNFGITLTVIAVAIGIWVYTRMTSLAGQLHSWSPPFTEYEVYTFIGGGIAVLLLIVGIQKLTDKSGSK